MKEHVTYAQLADDLWALSYVVRSSLSVMPVYSLLPLTTLACFHNWIHPFPLLPPHSCSYCPPPLLPLSMQPPPPLSLLRWLSSHICSVSQQSPSSLIVMIIMTNDPSSSLLALSSPTQVLCRSLPSTSLLSAPVSCWLLFVCRNCGHRSSFSASR
jgi:hypothetical protein